MKRIEFNGDSLELLRQFPDPVRKEIGVQLHKVQIGLDPSDWKPMRTVGPGVREIRVQSDGGAFRIVYLGNSKDAVHVLHAFQKKTRQTAKRDLDLAGIRLRQIKES